MGNDEPQLRKLPPSVAHFLGHRYDSNEPETFPFFSPATNHHGPLGHLFDRVGLPISIEVLLCGWVGSFCGIASVLLLFTKADLFNGARPDEGWTAPAIMASFGASSVLLYGAIEGPLAQPRCFVGGQFVSALTGVIVAKLFSINDTPISKLTNEDGRTFDGPLVFLCGALAAAFANAAMLLSGTVHPPGGATALLCSTNAPVKRLGFKVLPVVLVTSLIMLSWALIVCAVSFLQLFTHRKVETVSTYSDNIGRRRYPTFWWHAVRPFRLPRTRDYLPRQLHPQIEKHAERPAPTGA